jgi:hypothetical protein
MYGVNAPKPRDPQQLVKFPPHSLPELLALCLWFSTSRTTTYENQLSTSLRKIGQRSNNGERHSSQRPGHWPEPRPCTCQSLTSWRISALFLNTLRMSKQTMDADRLGFWWNIEDYPARGEAPNLEDEGQDVPEDDLCSRDCQVSGCHWTPVLVPIAFAGRRGVR